MKKKCKAILCIFLVTASIAGITACGSNAGTGSSSTEGTNTSAASSAAPKEKVQLSFWDMVWGGDTYVQTAKEVVDKFNQESSTISVKYQSVPWDNWYQTFTVAIAAGEAPDISSGAGYQQHQFAEMGAILALDPLIEKWKSEGKLDDFTDTLIKQFQYKGEQVGIPWNVDPRGIFYRKDLLEQAGIPVPTNWDELYNAIKKLTTKDTYGMVFPSLEAMGQWTLAFFMYGNGGDIVDKNQNADLPNPKNIEALDFLRRLKNEKLVPDGIAGYTEAEAQKLFLQGKAAFTVLSPSFAPQVEAKSKEFADSVEILPILNNKEGNQIAPCGINALMAYKQTKNPDAAMEFLAWWSENNSDLWTKGQSGPFPARTSQLKLPYITDNKFKKEFADGVIPHSVALNYPVENAFPQLSTVEGTYIIADVLQLALTSNTDSKTILTQINEKLDEILKGN